MMSFAFWMVTLAAAMGAGLAFLFLKPAPRSALLAAVHGIAGASGFGLLIWALQTPDLRADALGVGAFAEYAAVLIGMALVVGLVIGFGPVRIRRSRGLLIAIHGTIAVSGFVLLMAYRSLG
ncbi:MAG TPA: hypothetical protein VID67_07975 [Rhizomicrobium sp.]